MDYYETSLQPGEVLTSVHVPPRPPRSGLAFVKFLPRSQDDYAVVDVAAWLTLDDDEVVRDVRIALGSVAPTVLRAAAAEQLLKGEHLTPAVLSAAGDAAASVAQPEDDVRGSAAYKRELVKVLVGRALDRAAEDCRNHAARPGAAKGRAE